MGSTNEPTLFVDSNETFDSVVNGTVNGTTTAGCVQPLFFTDTTYVRTRYVVDVGLVLTLCLFGLVGNGLSFSVLGKMSGGATPCLLRSLAVADSVYLVACIFIQSGLTLHTHLESFRRTLPFYPYIDRYAWPLASMAQTSSVWLVVLVTTNRWIGICYPLKAKKADSRRIAGVTVLIVVAGAILFNFSTIFELKVVLLPLPCSNLTRLMTVATDLARNPSYRLAYGTILCFLFRSFIPLTLLIFFNVQLVRAIRRSANQAGKVAREQSHARSKFTVLVIGVVSVCILCELPDTTYRILLMCKLFTTSTNLKWGQLLYYIGLVANVMLTVNAAVNFLIYFVMGKNFRQCLQRQCCGQPGGRKRGYHTVSTTLDKSTRMTSMNTTDHD